VASGRRGDLSADGQPTVTALGEPSTSEILPKLFRRLAEHLALDETGKVNLAGFPAFLAAHNDRLFTVPAGQATSLDTLIRRRGQTLTLALPPEQIVFIEA
jgi:hypothetical protein